MEQNSDNIIDNNVQNTVVNDDTIPETLENDNLATTNLNSNPTDTQEPTIETPTLDEPLNDNDGILPENDSNETNDSFIDDFDDSSNSSDIDDSKDFEEMDKEVNEEIFSYEGANEYKDYLDTLEKEITDISNDEDDEDENSKILEEDLDIDEQIPVIKSEVAPIEVVDNTEDSQDLADEVGISNIYDEYKREILEPVFENQLRQSKNSVKFAYSKVKNTILSYMDIKQRFRPNCENFKLGHKIVFRIEVRNDCLYLYGNVASEELDKEIFGQIASNQNKQTPTYVEIRKDKEKLEVSSIEKGLKFIAEIAKRNEMKLKKSFAPKAYAERYPHNQQAVLRGKEEFAPIDNEFDDEEYDFIENELSCNIITRLMGEDFNLDEKQGQNKLDALRQQATTIKGAIAIAEPIVYFYDVALNNDNSIAYINVQQVLNDKFLGKILPVQYYSVAESSERITKLNLLAIKQVVKDCDDNPELSFAIKISCRLVARKDAFDKLIKAAQPKNDNLIMAFDCSLLELLGKDGENAINSLKQQGIKIMIDDTENASLRVLTEYPIDFLRFDSRYYNLDNPATLSHLDMLTGYAAVQAIVATSQYVNTTKEVDTMQKHGVMVIQGFAVNKPQRILNSAKKRIKLLKPFK